MRKIMLVLYFLFGAIFPVINQSLLDWASKIYLRTNGHPYPYVYLVIGMFMCVGAYLGLSRSAILNPEPCKLPAKWVHIMAGVAFLALSIMSMLPVFPWLYAKDKYNLWLIFSGYFLVNSTQRRNTA